MEKYKTKSSEWEAETTLKEISQLKGNEGSFISNSDPATSDFKSSSPNKTQSENPTADKKGSNDDSAQTAPPSNLKDKENAENLANLVKKFLSGFWRILLAPIAVAIAFECLVLAFLVFLFKVPTAALLEKAGFKETAGKILDAEEDSFFLNVVETLIRSTIGNGIKEIGKAVRIFKDLATELGTERPIISSPVNTEFTNEIGNTKNEVKQTVAVNQAEKRPTGNCQATYSQNFGDKNKNNNQFIT